MPTHAHVAAFADVHLPAGLVIAGALLMAVATVLGAWLALRRPGRSDVWLAAAAGALLVIAGLHLLPDAWSAARAARLWPLAVLAAALASFAVAGLVARKGCSCATDQHYLGGAGGAAALAAHRFLEGTALALTASLTVTVALAVHAMAEGLAVGALLGSQSRRRVAGWLAAMCLSPVAGAAAITAYPCRPPPGRYSWPWPRACWPRPRASAWPPPAAHQPAIIWPPALPPRSWRPQPSPPWPSAPPVKAGLRPRAGG